MVKYFTFLVAIFFFGLVTIAQEWQQTATTPEGGGLTEIVVIPTSNHIFVTTASFNWPNGDDGGVRRSTDDGDTWENVYDAYIGRTITAGADGNLYASIWPYPQDEGLYRSTDNGNTWQLLVSVPSGNNIFSIAISTSTNPHSIFAGTRQGVYRSTDNGTTWNYANSGIPADSWVRDIEVDSSGMVVAATTNGLYTSEDNGGIWEHATGAGIEDATITKIIFDYPFDGKDGNTRLLGGSEDGNIYEAFRESRYLTAALLAIFDDVEMSGLWIGYLGSENKKMHNVSQFPQGTQPGGFSHSVDNGAKWQQNNAGLPGTTVPASALSGSSTETQVNLKIGLFQNMNGGAKVFKIFYDWSTILDIEDHGLNASQGLTLDQNNPNPFRQTTIISFTLKNSGNTSLEVFSSDGRLVKTLLDGWQTQGEHQFTFHADDLEDGIYHYVIKSQEQTEVRKMIIVK